jgi:hypothetical protein
MERWAGEGDDASRVRFVDPPADGLGALERPA